MRILYHIPSLATIYAGRTIFFGYKNAFEDLGHKFYVLTADDDQEEVFQRIKPHIFMSSLSHYNLKFLNIEQFNLSRKKGMKAFMSTHAWNSAFSRTRINEPQSLKNQINLVKMIKKNELGDVFHNPYEQGDFRMEGFSKTTGFPHTTIRLAADKTMHFPEYDERFRSDVSFIGTYLPEKRKFIEEYVYPLRKRYNLCLYGQDWTYWQRLLGTIQRGGQYFNLPFLRSIQKAKLALEDERKIYNSSLISINIHEAYQKKLGGDCNERTFKIPLCGGFEITDDVACIRDLFVPEKEIIIAKNKQDWFDKIDYYIKNPEKREPIIKAGRRKVMQEHTYHNRVKQIIAIYKELL